MDEFAIIQKYFSSAAQGVGVVIGIGDDCAVVQPPADSLLVMSIDTMVSGVHFPGDARGGCVGARAMSGALSDLAAMGARPLWFTLALTIPEPDPVWLEAFSEGLMSIANLHECRLIGGDTTRGPLSVTIQVHGCVDEGKVLKRSGARPGDMIYVTGCFGDGAAALTVIEKKLTVNPGCFSYLMKRFYAPTPRIAEGERLAGVASAAIDVSDGLYTDLEKICEASGTGALIDVSLIPSSDLWRAHVSEGQRLQWVLAGGDDYQLCFTVPRANVARVESMIEKRMLVATGIGKMTDKMGVVLVNDGNPYAIDQKGYSHFSESNCE